MARSALSKPERKNYIDAVKCIHNKPALTPASIAAGARSRYDDFIVTHVQQTFWVHGTVSLELLRSMKCGTLIWHRPTSSPGIVTIFGPTSNCYETSAGTKATFLTTTGLGGLKTRQSPLFSTVAKPASAEMECIFPEGITLV